MTSSQRFVSTLARKSCVYLLGLSLVLGMRGAYLARMMGGSYRLQSLAGDVLALGLLMAAFHLVYFFLNRGLRPLERNASQIGWWTAGALRLLFVSLIVFPALLSFVQVHPQKIATRDTPRSAGLDFEPVEISSDGLTLRGWYIPSSESSTSVVLLVHGLNANKQNFLYPAKLLHDLGYPVLTFDLRSHGDSDGRTFSFGLKEEGDIHAAARYLKQRFPKRKLAAVGYSAGAAALLQAVGSANPFDKIVLDSPLVNIERVAKAKFLWAFGPLSEVAWQIGRAWTALWTGADVASYDGSAVIQRCDAKRFFLLHGTGDHLLPADETRRLASAAPGARTWFIEGADHLQGVGQPSYGARLKEFLDEPEAPSAAAQNAEH